MITVVIVGAGIGGQHMDGYAALPDRFRVKAICDLDTARAATVADPHGVAVMSDIAEALSDPEVDVIDVCLPAHMHFKFCMMALEAGKDVVCEKPIAASVAETDALLAKAAEMGKNVYPVFQYRYGPGMAQLEAVIAAGLTGKAYAATLETHWNRGAKYYDVGWHGTWAGEMGGVLIGHCIHIHDMLRSVMGPVARVYAELDTRVNDIEVEDCAALTLRMASGALVTSSVTLGCAENISRLRLMFEGMTVLSDLTPYRPASKDWSFVARDPYKQEDIDAVLAKVAAPAIGFQGLFEAMADAMEGKGGREVTLEDGRASIELATAFYASSRAQAPVSLPLAKDHPLYQGWLP